MCWVQSEESPLQVPAPFGYERATSVDDAPALLEEPGADARLLAGGYRVLLVGEPPSEALFGRAAALAAASCDPVTDRRGSKEYKRHVVGVLTERVLRRAGERAEEVV